MSASDQAFVTLHVCLVLYSERGGELAGAAAFRKQVAALYSAAAPTAKTVKAPAAPYNTLQRKIAAGSYDTATQNALAAVGAGLAAANTRLLKLGVISDQLNLLKDCGLYLRNGSEPALKRITAKVSILHQTWLSKYFVSQAAVSSNPQTAALKRIATLVKRLGGTGYTLDTDLAKAAREDNPETYKSYLAGRREAALAYKTTLSDYVRSSGQPHVPVGDALKHLKAQGIVLHSIPSGFDRHINIDDKGNYYHGGKAISQNLSGGVVQMNKAYGPRNPTTYVFKGQAPYAAGWTRFYTQDAKQAGREAKHEKVGELAQQIDAIRAKWQRDLKANREPKSTLATILELVYRTSGRIGSLASATGKKSADGSKTYGISVLLAKQVSFAGNKIRIKYAGKKGVMQSHVVNCIDTTGKTLFRRMQTLKGERGPNEYLFWVGNHVVTNPEVNTYLRSLGSHTTVHKLRHSKGDSLFAAAVEKCKLVPGKATQAQAMAWLKKEIETEIGPELGHMTATGKIPWSTAATNYISPALQESFFTNLGVRIPAYLEKLLRSKDT